MDHIALEARETTLGADHPATLSSVNSLALVLRYQGKYSEAEEMIRRALLGFKKKFGSDHPNTLISMCKLAVVLQYQGK